MVIAVSSGWMFCFLIPRVDIKRTEIVNDLRLGGDGLVGAGLYSQRSLLAEVFVGRGLG
jgi:hypothetical protein